MKTIDLCAWKLDEESKKLLTRIGAAIKEEGFKISNEGIIINIEEISIYQNFTSNNYCFTFGKKVHEEVQTSLQKWLLSSLEVLKDNKDEKKVAFDIIKQALKTILAYETVKETKEEVKVEEKKEEQKTWIEKDNIKYGFSEICDIKLTEEEALHLKRIKDIIGGGKLVITKGDLKIEIE